MFITAEQLQHTSVKAAEGCLCNPASAPVYIGMKMQSVIVSFPDIFPRRICSVSGMQGARHAPQIIECKDELCLCVTSGQIKVSLT